MGAQWIITCLVVAGWYISNIGVLLLNKLLLTSIGFRQPVFLTLCHMLACAGMGYVLSMSQVTPVKPIKSKKQLWKICLLSLLFCITIMLGNMSLKYIPISFNQAIGATTPLFTAVFALSMQGSRETRLTYAALIPVAGGVVIATGAEPSFHLVGFAACLIATAGRALKSVVQAILLMDPSEKLDAMSLLFYMSSFSIVLLLPASCIIEPQSFGLAYAMISSKPGFGWWLLCNSTLAYAVNLTNFLVTKYTSALTLQVLGNLKGVIAVVVSVALFRNPVTVKGMIGYLITVVGVILYSESKRRSKQPSKLDSLKADSFNELLEQHSPLIKAVQPGAIGPAALGSSAMLSTAIRVSQAGPNHPVLGRTRNSHPSQSASPTDMA